MEVDDDETIYEYVLDKLMSIVTVPHPNSRQACSIWLLAIVKNCPTHRAVQRNIQAIQSSFIHLLSEDNDIVQDTASNGLGILYLNSEKTLQMELTNTLLEQLSGGSRSVLQVTESTTVYKDSAIGQAPTGGNLSTYKELCSLASDLNQPDLIYKFMQLANHNTRWNSKLGAAFGIQSIVLLAQNQLEHALPTIIPRLYRYKYDPNSKIQNSMNSIWNAIVKDNNKTITKYYNEILGDIFFNILHHQFRVRISCCLALSDLMTLYPLATPDQIAEMWTYVFRVMDDIHEGTRKIAANTAQTLSKICVVICKTEHLVNPSMLLSAKILPVLLNIGITNTVPEVRSISLKTVSELVQYAGASLNPHMVHLIPALLNATGELESSDLNHLSTMLSAQADSQEILDYARADAAKSHVATKTMTKCIEFMDLNAIKETTPAVIELMKSSVILGTRVACSHYINLLATLKKSELKEMDKEIDKYFNILINGLSDRNAAVRRSYAESIGHLISCAKKSSVKKIFDKLSKGYFSGKINKKSAIARTLLAINKCETDILRDYSENVIPLLFFAIHEDKTPENKATIEMWETIWNDITVGESDIRNNYESITTILKTELESPQWIMKSQAANAIGAVATKLSSTLSIEDRKALSVVLVNGLNGRTWVGKERLLVALASLCSTSDNIDGLDETLILNAVFRESKKTEPVYQKFAVIALGDMLSAFKADRFEEFYNIFKPLLNMDIVEMEKNSADDSADGKSLMRKNYLVLKEAVWCSIGKAWPTNIRTQEKFGKQFLDHCLSSLKLNTRTIQISVMSSIVLYVDKLVIIDLNGDKVLYDIHSIITTIFTIVEKAVDASYTRLNREALGVVSSLLRNLKKNQCVLEISMVKEMFARIAPVIERDTAPEIQSRLRDIEDL